MLCIDDCLAQAAQYTHQNYADPLPESEERPRHRRFSQASYNAGAILTLLGFWAHASLIGISFTVLVNPFDSARPLKFLWIGGKSRR